MLAKFRLPNNRKKKREPLNNRLKHSEKKKSAKRLDVKIYYAR